MGLSSCFFIKLEITIPKNKISPRFLFEANFFQQSSDLLISSEEIYVMKQQNIFFS